MFNLLENGNNDRKHTTEQDIEVYGNVTELSQMAL